MSSPYNAVCRTTAVSEPVLTVVRSRHMTVQLYGCTRTTVRCAGNCGWDMNLGGLLQLALMEGRDVPLDIPL